MTGADQVAVVNDSCWKTQSEYSSGAALAIEPIQCRSCGSKEKLNLFLGVACQVTRALMLGVTVRMSSPRFVRSGS